MHLFFGMFLKECRQPIADINSSHASQFGSTPLYFLIYPYLNFTPSVKLIYSTNYFLLVCFTHCRHFSGSFDLASGLHLIFIFVVSTSTISLTYFTACKYTVSGNKPPCTNLLEWLASVGTLNLLIYEAIIIINNSGSQAKFGKWIG